MGTEDMASQKRGTVETPKLAPSLLQIAKDRMFSERCTCGEAKAKGKYFCMACWLALPGKMRYRLSNKTFSEGLAQDYDEAVDFIKIETGRVK